MKFMQTPLLFFLLRFKFLGLPPATEQKLQPWQRREKMVHPDKGALLNPCKVAISNTGLCTPPILWNNYSPSFDVNPSSGRGQVSPCLGVSFIYCHGNGGSERGGDKFLKADNRLDRIIWRGWPIVITFFPKEDNILSTLLYMILYKEN